MAPKTMICAAGEPAVVKARSRTRALSTTGIFELRRRDRPEHLGGVQLLLELEQR